jgi:hypothetical protein
MGRRNKNSPPAQSPERWLQLYVNRLTIASFKKNMKTLKLIITVLALLTLECSAQTSSDKAKIYRAVIEKFPNKNLPVINETISRIYKYDIDGDYSKWFYNRVHQTSLDTSKRVVTVICANPIMYSQTILEYLRSRHIMADPSYLLSQANVAKLDSVRNYSTNDRLISWEKAPLANSFLGNLFKKGKVIGLSNILFDQQNNIALVKLQVFAKNKAHTENPSWIFVLTKIGTEWEVIGSLDEKQQPTAVLQ